MAAKSGKVEKWTRPTLEWCLINKVGPDAAGGESLEVWTSKVKATSMRDGKLLELYKKSVSDRTAALAAIPGAIQNGSAIQNTQATENGPE